LSIFYSVFGSVVSSTIAGDVAGGALIALLSSRFSEDAFKPFLPAVLVCPGRSWGEFVEIFMVGTCKRPSYWSIASAVRRVFSIFSVRLVSFPPRQINTAEIIPHKNDAGMSEPVVHAGR
jgi:hypothetical protein